jgi:energy-coupling factor transporter transmembrane protein EcfT
MNPRIKALRAVSSRYLIVTIKPLLLSVIAAVVILSALILFLSTHYTAWWLFFFLPLLLLGLPAIALLFVAGSVAQRIAPLMTKEQTKAAKEYVNNMLEVSEGLQTPQFIIAFKIIRDVLMRKGQDGFIYKMTNNSTRLKKDFEVLTKLFADK